MAPSGAARPMSRRTFLWAARVSRRARAGALPPVTAGSASRRGAAEGVEAAGVYQLAGQSMPDDLLGHASDLDQRIEIDPGVDPHLLAQQHQLFGADIAGRLRLTGKRAAAEPADRRVELCDAELQRGVCIGDR